MKILREGDRVTLTADRRIDAYSSSQFAAEMEEALQGVTDLILDFSELTYISSTGLRVVMLAVKTMARQGNMRIVNVSPEVYEILEATGFTGVCDVELAE